MHISCSEWRSLNKTILIYISVGFKTIGTFALAIKPLLYVSTCFGVLSVINVFVFVWGVALSLNDTSIPQGALSGYAIHLVNNTDLASTNVKPLNAQLTEAPNGSVIEHSIC
jgi:hypothetical protein